MRYFSITPTVDIFEAVLVVIAVVGLLAVAYNVQDAWGAMQWGIDDADPFHRRLATQEFDNARGFFWAMLIILLMVISGLFVPSANEEFGDVRDTMNAIWQRVGSIAVVTLLTLKALGSAWTRRYAAKRRKKEETPAPTPSIPEVSP